MVMHSRVMYACDCIVCETAFGCPKPAFPRAGVEVLSRECSPLTKVHRTGTGRVECSDDKKHKGMDMCDAK